MSQPRIECDNGKVPRDSDRYMSSSIITKVADQMAGLPDELQQQVLTFVVTLQQRHQPQEGDAWDMLESMTGTVEAPSDWSAEHNHYLYGTPKRQDSDV